MNRIRKAITLAVVAAAAMAAACTASTHAPAQAAATVAPVQCPAGQSPACASWQDTSTTGVAQDLELFDHAGNPIWWVNNAGGMWVGNDRLGVTGSSVFNEAAYLAVPDGTHGELVIDGRVLTAADITMLHMMEKAHVTMADLRWLARHG